jgi:hypothetical protein
MDFLFGLLAVGLGLAFCFLGIRLFFLLLPVWGFLTGFSFGLVGTTTLLGTSLFADALGIVVGVVLGLVLAAASWLVYGIGVLIIGAGFGAGLGTGLMYLLGLESADILVLIVALAGAVVFAILALVLNLPKWLAIVFTAIGGAGATVVGVLMVLGRITIEQVEAEGNPLQPILSESLLWSAVLIVLAIAGIVVQYQWTRNWEMKSREMWKVETGL